MVKKAKYDVIKRIGKLELRRYGPLVIARTDGFGDGGFNRLFRYISGANRRRSKVEMTAPVISERISMTAPVMTGGGAMAFVMPEGYDMDTTPEPLDQEVMVVEVPARLLAVLRFSGRWTERAFEARSRELLGRVQETGLETRGEVFAMLYNPPFTPPFLRRNEVAVEIAVL
jgi:hypothetical protein